MRKLADFIERYANSLPLALKWSVMIACFVCLVMGTLGWYLIDQQTNSFRQQSELMGQLVVDQLARAAGEPLLASDDLTLQVLVSQGEKHDLIIGMEIYDLEGNLRANAGLPTNANIQTLIQQPIQQQNWEGGEIEAILFYSPILFTDVNAGFALVSIDRRPLNEHLDTLTRALLTTTVGLILVGIMLAFPLAFRLFRPIDQLVKAGEALDKGDTRAFANHEQRTDEIGRILTSFHRMSDDLEKKKQVEVTFSRHVSPSIAHQLLNEPEGATLGGITTEGSVLFCDIVGFTELSEDMSPEDVGDILNQYFSYFSLAAHSCRGTVDKFIGDCIMILFGIPDSNRLHGLDALTCAVLIQELAKRINQRRSQQGLPIVEFRLGINSGTMLAGNLGSEQRMQYTVVGDAVNLASRMCSHCEPGKILATEAVLNQPSVSSVVNALPRQAITVKGRRQPVIPYPVQLSDFKDKDRIKQELEQLLPALGHL